MLEEVQSRQRQVDQQAAHLAYEHGQALCEQGDVGQGILWLVRGLKGAGLAGDHDLERAFRLNLAAWWPRIHPLRVRCEHPGPIHAVAYSPDGRTIAICGRRQRGAALRGRHGRARRRPLHASREGRCRGLQPRRPDPPDRVRRLRRPALGHRRPARWSARSSATRSAVLGVAFSPDGRTVLTGSVDKTARLWDVADGRPIGRPMCHELLINSVAFSPDGRTVLTGSWDRTARLWDAATGDPIGPPLAHEDWVSSVAFSPDGRTILTGCYDRTAGSGTARPAGRSAARCGTSIASARWPSAPTGSGSLTGSYDGTARLWDVATARPVGRRSATSTRSPPWRSAPTAAPS